MSDSQIHHIGDGKSRVIVPLYAKRWYICCMGAEEFHSRKVNITRLYRILDELEAFLNGKRTLAVSSGRMRWPLRGMYFFFEPGETRSTTGTGMRVVRVGTHGLKPGGKSTLWGRLRTDRGYLWKVEPGGGNHHCSEFRYLVGTALIQKENWLPEVIKTWGIGTGIQPKEVRERERPLEHAVSQYIGGMPFLWVAVTDEPGRESMRGYLARNAIALLSNYSIADSPVDPPSSEWLGRWARDQKVVASGLWNVNYVADTYDPRFLDVLHTYVHIMKKEGNKFPI